MTESKEESSLGGIAWAKSLFERVGQLETKYTPKSHLTELEKFPPWVVKILRQLLQQNNPAVKLRRFSYDPEHLGRYLGQTCHSTARA